MSDYSKQVTILYVEDMEDVREGYARALRRISKELILAEDGAIGIQKYKEFSPDIVVSDIKMPNMNGLEMTKLIKEIDPNASIIFTTAHSESAYLLEAIEHQVEGYLLKPVDKNSLISLVEKVSKNIMLEKENEELKKELANMAYRDGLTGAFNRNKLKEVFEHEQKQSKRYNYSICVALLDIDHFKNFNDKYGHIIGDEVLKMLSTQINKITRATDLFARWGGEEFVILFNNITYDEALAKSEEIRKHIQTLKHKTAGAITASFGVTQLKSDDTLQSFLQRADNALYQAKENGRNCVVGKQ
jgi:diguanylate cyclase (GGDEF)-like protein